MMSLRGSLNREVNIVWGFSVAVLLSVAVYSAYDIGVLRGMELLIHSLAVPAGIIAGMPAYSLNRRALYELGDRLENKVFLSSQLALLDSRHGKNAVAYFYTIVSMGLLGSALTPKFSITAAGFFAFGTYFSANLLPFIVPQKRGSAEL